MNSNQFKWVRFIVTHLSECLMQLLMFSMSFKEFVWCLMHFRFPCEFDWVQTSQRSSERASPSPQCSYRTLLSVISLYYCLGLAHTYVFGTWRLSSQIDAVTDSQACVTCESNHAVVVWGAWAFSCHRRILQVWRVHSVMFTGKFSKQVVACGF